MKNSISQCSQCKVISTPRRWNCVKCGIVAQEPIEELTGKTVATCVILKTPQSEIKSLNEVSLSISENEVYFLS